MAPTDRRSRRGGRSGHAALTPELPAQVTPPEFATTAASPVDVVGVDTIALPVLAATDTEELSLGPGAAEALDALGVDGLAVLDTHGATGVPGEVFVHATSGDVTRVLFVGIGGASSTDLRRAGAALARALLTAEPREPIEAVATSVAAAADPADGGREAFCVGMMLGSFGFHWQSDGPPRTPVRRVVLALEPDDSEGDWLERAVALGGAGWLARALATVPSNLKTPAWLAAQAEAACAEAGVDVTVHDEAWLSEQGFGGVVAVGQGSTNPPRLIRMDYVPAAPRRKRAALPHLVLVGKGITFDTGGLSIKPAESMTTMKRDMTGGAVVIATMAALRAVGCPIRVTGLVPASENSVGGNSYRPGDVIRHYGGRTSEVTNTDAEGRLVMADAMAYAVAELKPDAMVDVATLTGAMKVGLGQRTGGLFANDEAIAAALAAASKAQGEPLWRMPLVADYEEKLASKVADADNGPSGPGAIMAALFLQHFTGDVPWGHLDIASAGDSPDERHEWTTGPTGFVTRTLIEWLGTDAPLDGVGA